MRHYGIERIAITHMHPDHVGGAEAAASATGAPVSQGALDYAQCAASRGSDDWPERIAEWFRGVRRLTERVDRSGATRSRPSSASRATPSCYEGIELTGHADGHLGFLRDGVLIGGDHLLQRITPAVGLYPESRPDPLGDYLRSL